MIFFYHENCCRCFRLPEVSGDIWKNKGRFRLFRKGRENKKGLFNIVKFFNNTTSE